MELFIVNNIFIFIYQLNIYQKNSFDEKKNGKGLYLYWWYQKVKILDLIKLFSKEKIYDLELSVEKKISKNDYEKLINLSKLMVLI